MRIPAKRHIFSIVLAGHLPLVGCGGAGSVSTPPQPSLSQTVSLVNEVDIQYSARLTGISSATRTITHNGTQIGSTTITYSPYTETLIGMEKGEYRFDLTAGDLSDSDSLTVPNYDPTSDFSSLETNLAEVWEGSSKTFDLERLLSDRNPEDVVTLNTARSTDGLTGVTVDGFNVTIRAIGPPGPYEVEVDFPSDEGGYGSGVIAGQIVEVPDQIAFMGFGENNRDIYLADVVTGILENIRRLTESPFRDAEPCWSSDGNEIIYTTNREDINRDGIREHSLYIMNADGSNQRRISPSNIEAMQPCSCSNGKIAFLYIDYSLSFVGIAKMNLDGTEYTRLVEEAFSGHPPGWPSWSPDCSQIAFMTHRDGNWEIYVANSDGSNQRNITNSPLREQQPRWSPDGSKIAFMSDRDTPGQIGEYNLYLVNPDGTGLERLTDFAGGEFDLSWFDSNRFAFTREIYLEAPLHIYMMNRDGSGLVQLTTEYSNRYPAWRPR